jgi:hypothetical protein
MKLELIVAIMALVVAIFNRPIELLWDEAIKHRRFVLAKAIKIFDFVITFIIPLAGLIYLYFFCPWNKLTIATFAIYSAMFFVTPMKYQLRHAFKRIRELEDFIDGVEVVEVGKQGNP